MNGTIVCIAKFTAKENKVDDLLSVLKNLIAPSRNESSCLSYELHQNTKDPKILTMIEKFENQAAFDFHGSTPHIENLKKQLGDLVESAEVDIYSKID